MEGTATIVDQVNNAYSLLHEWKNDMQVHADAIADLEEDAVQDILEDWQKARSNEVRRGLLQDQLDDNDEYKNHRRAYRTARNNFRLAQLEVERCKTVIAAIHAGSSYLDVK
jgi:hypothetical protein